MLRINCNQNINMLKLCLLLLENKSFPPFVNEMLNVDVTYMYQNMKVFIKCKAAVDRYFGVFCDLISDELTNLLKE